MLTLLLPITFPGSLNMADTRLLEEMDRKMKEILARGPAADIEKNLRVLLRSAFSRLDLVTREEFDVQSEVLARARARVAELEARVAQLEARASPPNN
jgi:BMFP domain-containing protein YqiC